MRKKLIVTVLFLSSILFQTLSSAQDIPEDVLIKIKKQIATEQPDDYFAQKLLVDADVKCWLELQQNYTDVPDSVFIKIKNYEAQKYPNQFFFQKAMVDADVKAWKELNR